jgi:hypothetical protein
VVLPGECSLAKATPRPFAVRGHWPQSGSIASRPGTIRYVGRRHGRVGDRLADSYVAFRILCHTHPVTVVAYLIASPFLAKFKTRYGCHLAEREAALIGGGDGRRSLGRRGNIGTDSSLASGRIAHPWCAGSGGVSIDTACRSRLLAGHMACRSPHGGESDLALAGGLNMILESRDLIGSSPVMNAENRRTLQCRLP